MTNAKITVDWSFTCDYALIDAGGKVSILGIFDRLFAATFPSLHPSLFLVAGWLGGAGEQITTEVRLWSPAKELVVTLQQQVALGPDGRSTGVMQISPVPLSGPGEYIFEFLVAGESLKHHRVTVETPPQSP